MKTIQLGKTDIFPSVISLGCMRIATLSSYAEAEKLVLTAVECGVNFFDHADIYGDGRSEELFGEILTRNNGLREKIYIQTKCGIERGKCYNFSKQHILDCVDRSLNRLKCGYIDILLLHRPDAIADFKEVAEAFDILETQGKVKHFGVSNMNSFQMQLYRKHVRQPLLANQLQLSILHCPTIDQGFNVNKLNSLAVDYCADAFGYCQLNDILIQPWSPLLASKAEGIFIDNPKFPKLNEKLQEIAQKYNATKNAVAIAWLLKHPANMQPIVGTTNPTRLREMCYSTQFTLTHGEWYQLYLAEGKILP